MRALFTGKNVRRVLAGIAVLVILGSSIWTTYQVLTLKQGESVNVGPVKVSKPARGVEKLTINDKGELVVSYTDGEQATVGRVVGDTGASGVGPSQEEIAFAVVQYCAGGRCDGRSPTTEQVIQAVVSYCQSGACKGDKGDTGATGATGEAGSSATPEEIAQAVSDYCAANNGCQGPQGATGVSGAQGAPGEPVQLSCVISQGNQYIAWKYASEPNTAYRLLYWINNNKGTDCVQI